MGTTLEWYREGGPIMLLILLVGVAGIAILFTGRYPAELYRFGVGVLRWNTRVEAYLLLLHDVYPPFSLE